MDSIRNGWFSEINEEFWPGQCFSLQVDQVLHQEKSKYQKIAILQTRKHGRALVLDDIIQCTEYDEFSYQEMISFLPLCAHPHPRRVLIVGGGDGGVAREVAKHPLVECITQVEIDGRVIENSKQYLPEMSKGFASGKLNLIVGDGFELMAKRKGEFDVIVTDSSDPIGPAVNLFTDSYFSLLKGALRPGGVICSQAGTVWLPQEGVKHVKGTLDACRKHFRNVKYAVAAVPTYPTGQIGFVVATDDADSENCDPSVPRNRLPDDVKVRYYDELVHRAAFVLPKWIREVLD